ncbi:amino acid transporter [Deinococcus detaillensis]|uniref:Amino acid transporter n=2 Tax=Deinococcus detaillensis TaxID=2592048 RepID=A0A553V267_9DEIO|nr:amino acid transporter [Deinococcus detaillensis]
MCLTGVDYFSTLGYQPGIAALAAGALSPVATSVLVLLTLFGAFPVYARVAQESPHGEGSVSMLERLLSFWPSKLLVLVLLGFMATDFIITITLSAADASAHLIENPFFKSLLSGQQIAVTVGLVALLGAVFLRGFREAIGIAVVLVGIYLVLNSVVVVRSFVEVAHHPEVWTQWHDALFRQQSSPFGLLLIALLVFPKLALGLSGFETGVAVMPQVRGAAADTEASPVGRIANARKLLLSAALIMSVFLVLTSLTTTLLIPPAAFQAGGAANGRALAYLAHLYLGEKFGTVYDFSTIAILWFAGASALAGLLNIVPRFLPRYGMAPEWTRRQRPLVLIFGMLALLITLIFKADVDAQGGAYATGVLVLMTSASIAVTIAAFRKREWQRFPFALIALIFLYTTVANSIERPDGLFIASFFILAILAVSIASRILRSFEVRVSSVELDESALSLLREFRVRPLRLVSHYPGLSTPQEYHTKEVLARQLAHLPEDAPFLFLEVSIDDASEFSDVVEVSGVKIGPYFILRARGSSVPNTIAALLLHLRGNGAPPQVYMRWSDDSPLSLAFRFLLEGRGDIPPITHEILRRAEPDKQRRPIVHVGG